MKNNYWIPAISIGIEDEAWFIGLRCLSRRSRHRSSSSSSSSNSNESDSVASHYLTREESSPSSSSPVSAPRLFMLVSCCYCSCSSLFVVGAARGRYVKTVDMAGGIAHLTRRTET